MEHHVGPSSAVVREALALDRRLPLLAGDLTAKERRALREMDKRLVRRFTEVNERARTLTEGWERRRADGQDPRVMRAETRAEVEEFSELAHEGMSIKALLHRWETLHPDFAAVE